MPPLQNLCQTAEIAERSGIHISKHIAHTTAWDALALAEPDNPLPDIDQATTAAQVQHIKQHVDRSTVLLDYGCGFGRIATQLLPQQTLGGYIGLDSSYEMLKLFHDRYDRADAEQSTPLLLLNADINHPPLKNGVIDVAVVAAVFRHNHKSVVQKAVYELARVVKPEGRVVVFEAFPRLWSLAGLQGQLYQMVLNLLGRPFKNGPVRYYTHAEVKRLFRDFRSVELQATGYAIIPPQLLILPRPLRPLWRTVIATPVNSLCEKITPAPLRRFFATHYDIIAKR